MKCPKCGNEVNNNSKFCTKCGYKLNKANEISLQSSSKNNKVIIGIIVGIIAVLIVVIGGGTYALLNGREDDNSLYETRCGLFNFAMETTETTEETTETTTETTTEETTAEVTTENEEIISVSPESNDEEIQNVVSNFYSYGWVMSTNNHDPYYVGEYSIYGSPAYNLLGIDYWQENTGVTFDRIYNVEVVSIKKVSDDMYDVNVCYTYELYNSEKDKHTTNKELAVCTVARKDGRFLVYDHKWVNTVAVDTYVTDADFY